MHFYQCLSNIHDFSKMKSKVLRRKKLHDGFRTMRQVEDFVKYTTLVMNGIKDAYLVDCCSLTIENIAEILNSDYFPSHYREVLCIVKLAVDVILVGKDALFRKLGNISENNWTGTPFIVDCDGDSVQLCTTERLYRINQNLSIAFGSSLQTYGIQLFSFEDCEELGNTGFSFIAGWLLGYPCIYLTSGNCGHPSCLSFLSLVKFTLRLAKVNIQEFTIPSLLLEQETDGEDILKSALSYRVEFIENKLRSICPGEIPFVEVKQEVITSPCISL